jgi:multiple antibiotic resistance protein
MTICLRKQQGRWFTPRRNRFVTTSLMVAAVCLLGARAAVAADATAVQVPMRDFPVTQIFSFLFLMLGPFKIIKPFANLTKGVNATSTRDIALWATLFSTLALALAGITGERILSSYGIPVPVLALAAGIVLFLVALLDILKTFAPTEPPHDGSNTTSAAMPSMRAALTQLSFPTIVTPYGIATLVVFLALSPDLQGQLTLGAILAVIMLLNLSVMLVLRRILPALALGLPIAAAVLGIVQVALGLQIIINSLKALGVM